MKETLVKYLAGLLDADGSLSFAFKKYDRADDTYHVGLVLSLASSTEVDTHGFIESLPKDTGLGDVYYYGKNNRYKSWKVAKRSHLETLLPRLIKHMVIKGKHWQWMLDVWREQRGSTFSLEQREKLSLASRESRISNAGPVKLKNHTTWAWLAGYLDGDGWYRISYQKHPHNYWSISVGAVAHDNDICALELIQKSFGGIIRGQGQSPHVKVWWHNLGIKDRSFALNFLPNLAKHSKLKRSKIDRIISHHRQRLSMPRADS